MIFHQNDCQCRSMTSPSGSKNATTASRLLFFASSTAVAPETLWNLRQTVALRGSSTLTRRLNAFSVARFRIGLALQQQLHDPDAHRSRSQKRSTSGSRCPQAAAKCRGVSPQEIPSFWTLGGPKDPYEEGVSSRDTTKIQPRSTTTKRWGAEILIS